MRKTHILVLVTTFLICFNILAQDGMCDVRVTLSQSNRGDGTSDVTALAFIGLNDFIEIPTYTIDYSWSNGGGTSDKVNVPNSGFWLECTVTFKFGVQYINGNPMPQVVCIGKGETYIPYIPQPCNAGVNITASANTLTAFATNTTGNVSYLWSDGSTNQSITVDANSQQTYSVNIVDGNECNASAFYTYTPACNATIDINTNLNTLTANVSNAPGTISYTWKNGSGQIISFGQSVTVASNIEDNYTVAIGYSGFGAGGIFTSCVAEKSYYYKPSCDASVAIGIQGNTLTANPLNTNGYVHYLWSNGWNSQSITINESVQETYNVNITDGNGCVANAWFTYTPTPTCEASVDISANGNTLNANTSNAYGEITYTWKNAFSQIISNNQYVTVPDNIQTTYYVTINYGNSCSASDFYTYIPQPCNAGVNIFANGSVLTAFPTNTTGNVNYLWSNGSTNQSIAINNGIQATYNVSITDGNGCKASASYTYTNPCTAQVDIIANGNTLTASVTNAPGTITYTWKNQFAQIISFGQSVTVSANTEADYTVAIGYLTTGNTGVFTSCVAEKTHHYKPTCTAVVVVGILGNVITANPINTTGYVHYAWSNGWNSQSIPINLDIQATYNVSITDANGCTGNTSYTYTPPCAAKVDIIANGNTLTASVTNAPGTITYTWKNQFAQIVSFNQSINATMDGNYTLAIGYSSYNAGTFISCVAEKSYYYKRPCNLAVSISAINNSTYSTLVANVQNASTTINYTWKNAGGFPINYNQAYLATMAGTYNLTVADMNGCTATASYTYTPAGTICNDPNSSCSDFKILVENIREPMTPVELDKISGKILGNVSQSVNGSFNVCADGTSVTRITVQYPVDNLGMPLFNMSNFEIFGNSFTEINSQDPNKFGSFTNLATSMPQTDANGNKFAQTIWLYNHPDNNSLNDKMARPARITMQFKDKNSGQNIRYIEFNVNIYRAPILLVHGVWADESSFKSNDLSKPFIYERLSQLSGLYNPDLVRVADYRNTCAEAFFVNRFVVPSNIEVLLQNLTNGFNATGTKYSVGKVDVVAHSMGGILTRLYAQNNYPETPYRNNIHRFITLNTPHAGSQVANRMFNANGSLSTIGSLMNSPKMQVKVDGAAGNLRVNSFEINNALNHRGATIPHPDIPVFAITSIQDEFAPTTAASFGIPLAMNLYDVFRQGSDLIVAIESQLGNSQALDNNIKTTYGTIGVARNENPTQPISITYPKYMTSDNSHVISHEHTGIGDVYEYFQTITTLLTSGVNDNIPSINNQTGANQSSMKWSKNWFYNKGFAPLPEYASEFCDIDLNSGHSKIVASSGTIKIDKTIEGINYNNGDIIPVSATVTGSYSKMLLGYDNNAATGATVLDSITQIINYNFKVPANAIGRLKIVAMATDTLNNVFIVDSTYVNIKPNATLDSLSANTEYLTITKGDAVPLYMYGIYSDGVKRSLNEFATDFTITADNVSIAKAVSLNTILGVDTGKTTLTITFAGCSKPLTVNVWVIPSIFPQAVKEENIIPNQNYNDSITNKSVEIATSVENNISGVSKAMSVYPNPAQTDASVYVRVVGLAANENVTLSVTNLLGQTVYTTTSTADNNGIVIKTINESAELAPGLYTITETSPSNVYSQKLVVKGR